MNTNKELSKILLAQISNLSRSSSIDFGLDICRRLLPDYIEFSIGEKWGDVEVLSNGIGACERNKLTTSDKLGVRQLIEAIDPIIPDLDDFEDGSYALNASNAVYELLEFLLDQEEQHIVNISSYMTDTMDFKIQEDQTGLSKEQLIEHPRIIEELKRQIGLSNEEL